MNDKTLYLKRCGKFIKNRIKLFDLNLSNLTIYTELGSGNYAFTPLIAAMANAKKVYAISHSSRFGTFESNVNNLEFITHTLHIEDIRYKIEVVNDKRKEHLQEADIVTNSGFVRPIDKKTISAMKETAVIPLMFETWEFRKEDVDLDYCKQKNILILGTNEECPPMDMMRYSGFLINKLMFECGMDVHKDKILILGSGRIGNNIARFMRINKIDFSWVSLDTNIFEENKLYLSKIEDVKNKLPDFDTIIIAENYHNVEIIGKNGLIKTEELSKKNSLIQIIHICGNVDFHDIKTHNLSIYPELVMPFGYMTVSADYIGPKATIELNTAGLKVGEIMARNRLKYDLITAYRESIRHPLVDDFRKCIWEKKTIR